MSPPVWNAAPPDAACGVGSLYVIEGTQCSFYASAPVLLYSLRASSGSGTFLYGAITIVLLCKSSE